MSRIETTEVKPPSIPLNLACLAAPTLAPLAEMFVLRRVRLPFFPLYYHSGTIIIAQWVLGFIIGVVLAYRAPTPRLRCAAKWYAFGTLLLPVIIFGFIMYLANTGAFD